jgi:hypothetical protein
MPFVLCPLVMRERTAEPLPDWTTDRWCSSLHVSMHLGRRRRQAAAGLQEAAQMLASPADARHMATEGRFQPDSQCGRKE